ncbi:hypothetical protein AHAS_Ahas12G0099300 [Arachis hypogaea]
METRHQQGRDFSGNAGGTGNADDRCSNKGPGRRKRRCATAPGRVTWAGMSVSYTTTAAPWLHEGGLKIDGNSIEEGRIQHGGDKALSSRPPTRILHINKDISFFQKEKKDVQIKHCVQTFKNHHRIITVPNPPALRHFESAISSHCLSLRIFGSAVPAIPNLSPLGSGNGS